MASSYNVEPPPYGRVLIQTTMGPLDVELFTKETPQTCRSFIQLCLEGYYDNIIFHRIIKDFIVQTGDPTGTGTGGEAATPDGVLKDEFHSRLRYNRRGLVGMANSGEKDDNGSQFFITLSATPELERKNTLFGRIAAGDTIYNVLRIGELEVDKMDRPLHPPRIISIEVTENPFTDIVPRSTAAERQERQRQLEAEKQKEVVKKAKKRNKALLSFGDDEGEEETVVKTKVKSIYDLDGTSQKPLEIPEEPPKPKKDQKKGSIKGPLKPAVETPSRETVDLTQSTPSLPKSFAAPVPIVVDDTSPPDEPEPVKRAPPTASLEDQIASLKSQLKGLKKRQPEQEQEPEPSKRGKKLLESEISKYIGTGKAILGKRSRNNRREDDTLSKLTNFQKKILGTAPVEEATKPTEDVEQEACELHNVPGCMSCFDRFGEQPDEDDPKSLWGHKLVFAKDMFGKDEKYRFERQGEELEVIDPRERAKEFAEQEKHSRHEGRSTKVWRQDSSGHRSNR